MKRCLSMLVSVVASCAVLGAGAVHADQLADVKTSGKLVCGVLDIFEPFGFTDTKSRSLAGYDVDVCEAVSKKLGVKAEIKPVSIEARIPELQQKHMDLLSAGLAYTPQRAEQVSFSDAYYVSASVLTVKTSRGFKQTSDLAGKRISFVKGGTSAAYIREALPTATPVGFEDGSTGFTALVQNKVVGYNTSEEVVRNLVNRLGDKASEYTVLEPAIGREVWGLGVRKDEPAMLEAVNMALRDLESSGEMQAIFDKWLGAQTLYKMNRSFKVEAIN